MVWTDTIVLWLAGGGFVFISMMRNLLAVFALALTACGALPPQPERVASTGIAPRSDDRLVRIARDSMPNPTLTGFRLMPLGAYSLDARIELIRRAQSSLDVQYYLVGNDRTGRLFMRNLRDAAMRGVRVRLLVDDINTVGADPLFTGLAAFPNVEVRLFNPFCCARQSLFTRFAASLTDFQRLNRRMHNKLFIADGAFVVMGGRNIADEYFARGATSNFVDMDVLLAGEAVKHFASIFDVYWNNPQAYPVDTIVGAPANASEAQALFDRLVNEGDQMFSVSVPPMDMLAQRPLGVELDAGRLSLIVGDAIALFDYPEKVVATSVESMRALSVQMNIMDRVAMSKSRAILSSPYFVPGPGGSETFAGLAKRGVEVEVLTNSLAANDVPVVHIGYARYRPTLIRHGVHLYELNPGSFKHTGDALPGWSHGRLHAKVAILDESVVYIGSMNLDPRSENSNTELGLVARCPALAKEAARVIDATIQEYSYQVRLQPDGESLEWRVMGNPHGEVLFDEPESSPWVRFRNMLLQMFVPEQLL